jgi:uncharacterized membrane protein
MSKEIKHYLGDKDVQLILGNLLRVGVLVSTGVVILGGILFLSKHHYASISLQKFEPKEAKFASVAAILSGLRHLDGLAIIQFGVLLLIFTPIARVVFSIFSFLMEKDYQYVLIGIIVLCVIITSLYLDIVH